MLSQAPAPVQWLMTKLFEHLNKSMSINYDVQDERYSKFNIRSYLLDLASARVEWLGSSLQHRRKSAQAVSITAARGL